MDLLGSRAKGSQKSSEIEARGLQNLYSIRVQKGLIHCNFIVPESLSKILEYLHRPNLTWLTLLVLVLCILPLENSMVSVDFNVSYFSAANIQVCMCPLIRLT
ncbi:hypothetical protein MKW94_016813 [Papaver nudicaule]|uniref:Uncharacterized protein n=1 Tax=Papaver nudicaule TaxID=74823 RepID=A0AA41VAV5_PAPNU|nr:hypothetical protein [Papaver nudicaule]